MRVHHLGEGSVVGPLRLVGLALSTGQCLVAGTEATVVHPSLPNGAYPLGQQVCVWCVFALRGAGQGEGRVSVCVCVCGGGGVTV